MTHDPKSEMTVEERKRLLLAEGALLRIGIMDARSVVRGNLNPESLAKGALNRVVGAAYSTFGGAFSSGNLQALSPLLIGGISLLTKRYLRKPLMYGGVISAVASLAYYLSKKKKRSDDDADASVPDGE